MLCETFVLDLILLSNILSFMVELGCFCSQGHFEFEIAKAFLER